MVGPGERALPELLMRIINRVRAGSAMRELSERDLVEAPMPLTRGTGNRVKPGACGSLLAAWSSLRGLALLQFCYES